MKHNAIASERENLEMAKARTENELAALRLVESEKFEDEDKLSALRSQVDLALNAFDPRTATADYVSNFATLTARRSLMEFWVSRFPNRLDVAQTRVSQAIEYLSQQIYAAADNTEPERSCTWLAHGFSCGAGAGDSAVTAIAAAQRVLDRTLAPPQPPPVFTGGYWEARPI